MRDMYLQTLLPQPVRQALLQDIQGHLLQDVLGFWTPRACDVEHGGYHTHFDRQGRLLSNEKNTWLHARQTWLFARVYQDLVSDPSWLALARQGRDWLVGHAYAGGGRWNYLLNAEGRVQQGTIALYTDLFVLMALCAYLQASGQQQDLPLVEATFQAAAQNLCNDQFPDLFPQQYQPGRISHGKYMIALNAFACAAPVLGWNRCKPLIAYCLDRIFGVLADPVRPTVYELRTLQGGGVDTEEGHRLNPGHIFESMWFVLALPPQMVSPDQRDLALRIVRATADQSLDRRYGGVVHMLDDEGHEGRYVDWDPNRALKWDEKVWWTHAEVLCALLIHADQTGSKASLGDFMALYTWCKRHFWDEEYGEWYAVLHRDGKPRIMDKGGLQKSAFHVPRALYNCCLLLQGKPIFGKGGEV